MGVSPADLVHIRRGALLHDIGKMGIPDNILLKPGPLTEEEWVVMRQHPTYAYELLSPIDLPAARRWISPTTTTRNGTAPAIPMAWRNERIPLAARIFSIVDVWDALRSDRPYRAGWPEAKVQAYLLAESGRHFDPNVVSGFMSLDLAEANLVEASD